MSELRSETMSRDKPFQCERSPSVRFFFILLIVSIPSVDTKLIDLSSPMRVIDWSVFWCNAPFQREKKSVLCCTVSSLSLQEHHNHTPIQGTKFFSLLGILEEYRPVGWATIAKSLNVFHHSHPDLCNLLYFSTDVYIQKQTWYGSIVHILTCFAFSWTERVPLSTLSFNRWIEWLSLHTKDDLCTKDNT